jgi:two-component system chemotaxis response regulator CheB
VLPVVEAEHGVRLVAGQVTVVPPGRHLLITAGAQTALIASGAFPPSRPSADLLLATLATAVGGRAIAVILSGGGHDGATGATAVHVCGGIVLVTDETSSASYSMPRAAIQRKDVVNRIVPLDDVADLLIALVSAPRTSPEDAAETEPPVPTG